MRNQKYDKKIILLNQVSGYMMIDIVNAFAGKSGKCILLTGELRKRRVDLNPEVRVIKLIKYYIRNNFTKKFSWIIAFIQATFIILLKGKKADLFITTNPPLNLFIPLIFRKNAFYLLVYDVYPDVLVQYKIISEKSFLNRFWENSNRKIFKRAEKIFTISNGMKNLLSKYIEPERISVVNCWADNNFMKPIDRNDNLFIKRHSLEDKFLVIYSGKLGFTHDVEVLIELAEKTKNKDIFYVIIGEGDKKKLFEEKIKTTEKNNIKLFPWQDISVYNHSLSAADIAVVSLGKHASLVSVPSKLYDIMAVGAPVLSVSENNSEIADIVEKYKIGSHFSAGQTDEMLNFICNVQNDKNLYFKLKNNSLKASGDFTPENAKKFL